jgi:hypothetical protein
MSRSPTAWLAVVAVGLLALGLVVGPAAAGDNPSTIDFEPRESTAAPGETVELAVILDSDGGYNAGVGEFELRIEYDSEHVTVTDVESAGWFEQEGADVSVDTNRTIDDEAGVVTYTEIRRPAGEGTVGGAPAALLTVDVDADAPVTNASFSAGNSTVLVAGDSGYPQPIAASRIATLSVTDEEPVDTTDDELPSPVIDGIALLGALLSTHFLLARRS